MNNTEDTNRWNAKHDAFRSTTEFTDLLRIVACYYEMYSKATTFLGPWIAKEAGKTMFLVPNDEQIKSALGKERPAISFRARSAFVESLTNFLVKTRGKKTLITPSPSSHHSAQFPAGTFSISQVESKQTLRDDKALRKEARTLHKIEFANAEAPVFIENLGIPPEQVKFLILRPKLGKLGTASTSRWEVLLFKRSHGYLVEHVDSELNPRWSGVF